MRQFLGVLVDHPGSVEERSQPVTPARSLAHTVVGACLDLSREWENQLKTGEFRTLN